MIEESLADLEKKEAAISKRNKTEASGAIQTTSFHAAQESLKNNLDQALALADAPEAVETILMQSAVEAVRKELGSAEDFRKTHENEKVNQLYANVDEGIHYEVRQALLSELNKALEAERDEMKKQKLQKILLAISPSDGPAN